MGRKQRYIHKKRSYISQKKTGVSTSISVDETGIKTHL